MNYFKGMLLRALILGFAVVIIYGIHKINPELCKNDWFIGIACIVGGIGMGNLMEKTNPKNENEEKQT
jgi:hypothetical protein